MIFRNEKGQAATEFIIAAVFILIPLFIIIPLLGKYVDIRHAAVQKARYDIWEYTVWYGPTEKKQAGLKEGQFTGRKSFQTTQQESNRIFFSNPFGEEYAKRKKAVDFNPLWIDQNNDSLFVDVYKAEGKGMSESNSPGWGIINGILNVFNMVISTVGKVMSVLPFVDKANFDSIYTKGFYSTELDLKVRSPKQILPYMSLSKTEYQNGHPLIFKAKAAVQSNYWNSGSSAMAVQQSKGLIVTPILQVVTKPINAVLGGAQKVFDFIGKIFPITIKPPKVPKFGYMKEDLVPYEHLESVSKDGHGADKLPTIHEESGLYYYQVDKKK